MNAKSNLERLLDANPGAKKYEGQIRETLRDLEQLKKAGVASRGYTLTPPYGDKRQSIGKAAIRPQAARKTK